MPRKIFGVIFKDLPSLERLAQMNRRAIVWAFPLLTAGLLLGVILLVQRSEQSWTAPKVLSTAGLWLAFLVLIYLRYFVNSSNRNRVKQENGTSPPR